MEDNAHLLDALHAIPCADLTYQEWASVGMALKEEGYDCAVWEEWSRLDNRYHAGECERKWRTFRGTGNPVKGGTIVNLAKRYGYRPTSGAPDQAMGWDDMISGDVREDGVLVDKGWIQGKDLPHPIGSPVQQLSTYLETLFDSSEFVGYCTEVYEKEDKLMPQRGIYSRTAGDLLESLSICDGDLGGVIGDWHKAAGAWIRFNPLDGQGVRNENVTRWDYALVESDSMPVEEQYAIYQQMELPIACLVTSGKKSLHAIVRVDAANFTEYRKRVDYLYRICEKNGLQVDQQNKNPSRLSRMPGVTRNGVEQSLIAVKIGKSSWVEWQEWVEAVNDDLPDFEGEQMGVPGNPSPELIRGVLRQGHKLLLSGPSKAGKSFALIELAIAISEGIPWMGFECAKGRVLYVNLELDKESCKTRFADVRRSMKAPSTQSVDMWHLRGRSVPMDKLAPKLIRRAAKQGYLAIIIDPIYKIITGDENSADQMAAFCNQFDKVCTELGCAVIYCHHHSKGAQGGKKSMDRASGSGVFARDPDALLDMIQLELTEDIHKQRLNNAICALCGAALEEHDLSEKVSQDDLCSRSKAMDACADYLPSRAYDALLDEVEQAERQEQSASAWRIEPTLREFPSFRPINTWFEYPVHKVDQSGVLDDIQADGTVPAWQKNYAKSGKRRKTPEERKAERAAEFEQAFAMCESMASPVTVKALAEYMNVTDDTIRKRREESAEKFWIDNGTIGRK